MIVLELFTKHCVSQLHVNFPNSSNNSPKNISGNASINWVDITENVLAKFNLFIVMFLPNRVYLSPVTTTTGIIVASPVCVLMTTTDCPV